MTTKRLSPSKGFRIAVSCLLVLHLLALFLPPLSFQTRGPLGQSPSVAAALWPLEGYGQFLYMDRGYAFFAPDPGPSHLIQVAVSENSVSENSVNGDSDSRVDSSREEFMVPDRGRLWPRLLYHRHFMLTEQLGQYERLPEELREKMVKAYAEQICREHNGDQVTLKRVYHDVPSMERVLAGGKLSDPDLYFEEPLGTFTWADF